MWTVSARSLWKLIIWQRNFSNTSKYHDSLLPPVIWTWLRAPPNITVSVYSLVKTKERNSLFNQEVFENTHFQFVPQLLNERESFFSLSIFCFWSPFFKTAWHVFCVIFQKRSLCGGKIQQETYCFDQTFFEKLPRGSVVTKNNWA